MAHFWISEWLTLMIAFTGVRTEDEDDTELRDVDDEDEVGMKGVHQPSLPDIGSFPGMILLNPPEESSQHPISFQKMRLGLLIDAIEHALVHPMEMADEVTAFFSKYADIETINCYPDMRRGKKFTLNRHEILAQLPVAQELKTLLKALREDLKYDRA